MSSAFQRLHAGMQRRLWEMKWTELRPIQVAAIEHLLAGGGDCIISSPTASGKTEAAFLPILSAIADDKDGSVRAMYVGPLKALINDQFGRLEELCGRMQIPVHKWHGDVGDSDRRALLEHPGGVLLITPESLEAMFVLRATRMPSIFGRLAYVVIDELHAFIGSVRGAQLQSQLSRLAERCGCEPVRVGLSATLAEPERAQAWLHPGKSTARWIAPEMPSTELALRVRGIWKTPPDDAADASTEDPSSVELARAILVSCRGATNLVFANAKSRIEQIADALTDEAKRLGVPDEIVVHHGSLSRERREYAEQRLRDDRPCTAVCSNTLELGVDIGEIDCVVQVDAPWTVASLVQRLGRSGRRPGHPRKLRGFLVEERLGPSDDIWKRLRPGFVQAIAVCELMLEKFLEPPRTSLSHRSTMVHQLLSIVAETGGVQAATLYKRLSRSGAFGPISTAEFAGVLRELGRRDLLEQMPDGSLVLGLKGQRLAEHYSFYAAFQGASEFRVVHGSEPIGTLPELSIPPIGEHFILAGRRWQVRDIDGERREISVFPSKGRKPPWFGAGPLDIHPAVHAKMRDLFCGETMPSYLDDVAVAMLGEARRAAEGCRYFRPPIEAGDGGTVRLFLFHGSRAQETLRLALARDGLKPRSERIGIDVTARLDEVVRCLGAFADGEDDGSSLAEYAESNEGARFGGDKFDAFLPSLTWRAAFVNDRLDLERARSVARDLVALAPRPPRMHKAPRVERAANQGLEVLAGLRLGGSNVTEFDDLLPGDAILGRSVAGPSGLLRDLELRLGLTIPESSAALRIARWSARMAQCSPRGRFYSNAYGIDAWGTAAQLLRWRDELVLAGWDGQAVEGGGERFDALRELELAQPIVPPCPGERLRRVADAVVRTGIRVYDRILLAEDLSLWPVRWRDVFERLRAAGCRIEAWEPALPLADTATDLGRIQRHLRSGGVPVELRGDGSLLVVDAETPWEAAHATAALLQAMGTTSDAVLIRQEDDCLIDAALRRQGFPSLGTVTIARWQPILQLLPLAVELAFEPKDPFRVLELLLLRGGPFDGYVGRTLARHMSQSAGFRGERWNREKRRIAEQIIHWRLERAQADGSDQASTRQEAENDARAKLAAVEEWIEAQGCSERATREQLQEIAARVRRWLLVCYARSAEDPCVRVALTAAEAFSEAVGDDPREGLTLVQSRQLLDSIRMSEHVPGALEGAGRLDHVDDPQGVLAARAQVIWWSCVNSRDDLSDRPPWTRSELQSLRRAGVTFVDGAVRIAHSAGAWRRAVLAATERLVLVKPIWAAGEPREPHPILDELAARVVDSADPLARVTVTVQDLLRSQLRVRVPSPEVRAVPALALPEPRLAWSVHAALFRGDQQWSPTSVETVLGCPLRWVLRHRAGLEERGPLELPTGVRLYGNLGHRLVERMHAAGDLASVEDVEQRARNHLQVLVEEEGAPLLVPGMATERAQRSEQLVHAVSVLTKILAASRLHIVGIENKTEVPWRAGTLSGRSDLLLRNEHGAHVSIDLKWGRGDYRALLEDGTALQLAAYAHLHRAFDENGRASAVAAYYSLGRGTLLTTDEEAFVGVRAVKGPSLTDVWRRVERTFDRVTAVIGTGTVPVAGVSRALPVVEAAGADRNSPDAFIIKPEAMCRYCRFDAICGRRWENAK